ncbi:MAG TPA: cell division protein FtsZ, partial [Chloroflexota bacterium]
TSIEGAKGVLMNISGGEDLTLAEVHEAAQIVADVVDPEANIIFGAVLHPRLEGQFKMTLIATGFARGYSPRARQEQRSVLHQPKRQPDYDDRPRPSAGELDVPAFMRRRD